MPYINYMPKTTPVFKRQQSKVQSSQLFANLRFAFYLLQLSSLKPIAAFCSLLEFFNSLQLQRETLGREPIAMS